MITSNEAFETDVHGLQLGPNGIHVSSGVEDPRVVGVSAPVRSLYYRTNGEIYRKTGPSNTDWSDRTHRSLDQLVHEIAETSYTEIVRTDGRVTGIIVYTAQGGIKIRETQIVRIGGLVDQEIVTQYDAAGNPAEILTVTYTRTNGRVTSESAVLS